MAPAEAVDEVGSLGMGALWFGFGVLGASAVLIFLRAFSFDPARRIFHYLSSSEAEALSGFAHICHSIDDILRVCAIASLAYLSMALGLGFTKVRGRQLFFARYIDWVFTTPLILTSLGLLARLSLPNIFVLVVLDELMVVSGVLGALVEGAGSWALFAFGCCCFLPLLYFLFEDLGTSPPTPRSHRSPLRWFKSTERPSLNTYERLGATLAALWSFYPALWVLSRTRGVSVNAEVALYAVLDITNKAGFLAWLISTEPEAALAVPQDQEQEEMKQVDW